MKIIIALVLIASLLAFGCTQPAQPQPTVKPTAVVSATPVPQNVDTGSAQNDLQASQQELQELQQMTNGLDGAGLDVSDNDLKAFQ